MSRTRCNSGRKRIKIDESSKSTKRNRALELLKNNDVDIEVLRMALKIAEKEEKADLHNSSVESIENEAVESEIDEVDDSVQDCKGNLFELKNESRNVILMSILRIFLL